MRGRMSVAWRASLAIGEPTNSASRPFFRPSLENGLLSPRRTGQRGTERPRQPAERGIIAPDTIHCLEVSHARQEGEGGDQAMGKKAGNVGHSRTFAMNRPRFV